MFFDVVVTLIFGALFLVWSRKTGLNFTIKVIFFIMVVWSIFRVTLDTGYVVKPTTSTKNEHHQR